ncbi:MAG TPA: RagB/SusD family nutrient uptake outer membrane protein [Paludibacter sp.]|nr:RagB/SusD family nutrient uptake outer membrane protein [Paludibacter sp.]
MKKYIYITIFFFTLLSISCEDFLQEKVYTQVTSDYIVSTPSGMASAVLAMYNKDREIFRNNSDTETTLWTNMLMGDDITVPRAGNGVPQFGRLANLQGSTGNVGRLWRHMYAIIGYANLVVDASQRVDMTDPVAIQALAEARVFRAHAYFWLIRKFDRIYLNTRVTTPENVNDSIVYTPADPDDVFALINEDLNYAIEHLSWETSQPGRFTQGAARHIKAKVAAWLKDWQEVGNQVNIIDQSGFYNLVSLEEIFGSADLNHSEAILVSQWSKGIGGWYINPNTGSTSGHRMPLHFTPNYHQEQGMLMDFESGAYPWGRLFPNEHLLKMYDQTKDRRYQVFYKHTWHYNNPAGLPRGKKMGDPLVPINQAQYLNLHPACTKYNDSYTRLRPDETQSFKDIIIYRLAETYLMGAEAYYHLGKTDSLSYYYNKTWERAGNAKFTGAITLDMIIDEHARELALEGDRWFFLKRNGLLIENIRKYGGEYIEKDGVVLMNDTLIRDNVQPHHVRLPIPQTQIDIMGKENFPQNEGYN